MSSGFLIRPLLPADIAMVQAVEASAAEKFRSIGMGWVADAGVTPDDSLHRYIEAGTAHGVVATDGGIAGFCLHDLAGDNCYLAEIGVATEFSGRRLGAALIDHVADAGRRAGSIRLILRTFATVPWNAPYYTRLGFRAMAKSEENSAPLDHPRFQGVIAGEAQAGMSSLDRVFMERAI